MTGVEKILRRLSSEGVGWTGRSSGLIDRSFVRRSKFEFVELAM